MNKLKIKLSRRKTLSVDLPVLEKRLWPFYLLDILQYLLYLSAGTIFVFGIFNDNFGVVDFYKLVLCFVILLGVLQIIRVIIGGLKFFPESRFDLFSLILLIGLISTLLLKQFFNLIQVKSMLPDENNWQITVWGILVFLLASYLIDISSRSMSWLKIFGVYMAVLFEIALVVELIVSGDISAGQAVFVFLLVPFLYIVPFVVKSRIFKLFSLVNVVLLAILAFLNLPVDFVLIFTVGTALAVIIMIFFKVIEVSELQEALLDLTGLDFNAAGRDKVFKLSSILIPAAGAVTTLVLALRGEKFQVIKDVIDTTKDILDLTPDLHTFFIGDEFFPYMLSTGQNIYVSYGALGLILIAVIMFMFIYSGFKLLKLDKVTRKMSGLNLFGFSLFIFSIFGVLAFLFVNLSVVDVIFGFVMLGILGSLFAIREGQVVKPEFMKIKKPVKFIGKNYKFVRIILVLLISIAALYVMFNFNDIFIG